MEMFYITNEIFQKASMTLRSWRSELDQLNIEAKRLGILEENMKNKGIRNAVEHSRLNPAIPN